MYSYQEMVSMLNSGGYRLTGQRLLILETLQSFHGSFSALELEKKVMKKDQSVGRATLFRALDLFLEKGILEKIHRESGDDVYIVGSSGHHHHLICRVCGLIRDIEACPFGEDLRAIVQQEGFSDTLHRVEIEGVCRACQKKQKGRIA